MKLLKDMLLFYAITESGRSETLLKRVEEALLGGVTLVQLREKDLSEERLLREASALCELCHRYQVPLIVNDNLEIALKSGADGVHVGADDLPVGKIRERVGKDFIVGATAKTVEQARAAQSQGADYLGVGAIFPSPTKQNAVRVTREELGAICAAVDIPVVAIGGISAENLNEIAGVGIAGVAVVSAIFSAKDILAATRELKEKIRMTVGGN